MATDTYRALAIECAALPDDGLLSVLAGDITPTEGQQAREIQGELDYATRGRTPEETAALEATLLAFRNGPLDVRAEILEEASMFPSATVEVTAAQLMALSTTPVVIVPARPGYCLIPKSIQFDRLAGTAYTLNSVARLSVKNGDGSGLNLGYCDVAGLMDQGAAKTAMTVNTGSQVSAYVGFSAAQVAGVVGDALVLTRESGTDLSAGTGGLRVTVWYQAFQIPS